MSLSDDEIRQLKNHVEDNRRKAMNIGSSAQKQPKTIDDVRAIIGGYPIGTEFKSRDVAEGTHYTPSVVGQALSALESKGYVETVRYSSTRIWRTRRPPGASCPSCGTTIEIDGCPYCERLEEAGIA